MKRFIKTRQGGDMNYENYIEKRMLHVGYNHAVAYIESIKPCGSNFYLTVRYIVELPRHCYDRFEIVRQSTIVSAEDLEKICFIDNEA